MTDLSALTGTWTIDPEHTRVGFSARHAMITKVRGSFGDVSGTATIDGANLGASTVNITLQAESFTTNSEQRDGHVKGTDFLDVASFPVITLTSTRVEQTGEGTADITGDLTIKGATKSVTIPMEFTGSAKDPFGNIRAGFEGETSLSRAAYGITWNAALETGGVLVSDKVALDFEVSMIKSA